MFFSNRQSGLTLVELITVLAVLSILVMISSPFYSPLLKEREAGLLFGRFYPALITARSQAAMLHYSVGVCGSANARTCDHNWNAGILLFIDKNRNRQFDPDEAPLGYYPTNIKYGQVRWRGAGSSSVLLYTAERGRLDMSNGSFWYCAERPQWHRLIILPKIGHPRGSRDSNGDGIHETASGVNITC